MSRYIERAENIARILDVNLQLLLDFRSLDDEGLRDHWMPIVQATGDQDSFVAQKQRATASAVAEFMVFRQENPNSIVSSVCQARENARMVREQLSEELWEELNSLYLFLNSNAGEHLLASDPPRYYETIRRAAYTFHGIASASTARSDAWEFMDLGRHLERADKTTRFLDITSFLSKEDAATGEGHTLHWLAILRSCGALGAFRAVHSGELSGEKVADFLLFSRDFPRAVRFCVDRIDRSLHRISGSPRGTCANEAERLAGRLLSELSYGSVAEVMKKGLHEHLDALQGEFNDIGAAAFRAYVLLPDQIEERPPIPAASVSAVVAWQMAQQQQQQQ